MRLSVPAFIFIAFVLGLSPASASSIGYQYYLLGEIGGASATISTLGLPDAAPKVSGNVQVQDLNFVNAGAAHATFAGSDGLISLSAFAEAHDSGQYKGCGFDDCPGQATLSVAIAALDYADTITATSNSLPDGTLAGYQGHLGLSVSTSNSQNPDPTCPHTYEYIETGLNTAGQDTSLELHCQAFIKYTDFFGTHFADAGEDFFPVLPIGSSMDFTISALVEVRATSVDYDNGPGNSDSLSGIAGLVDATHTVQLQLLPRGNYSYVTASGNSFLRDIGEVPTPPSPVPEPASLTLLGLGLAGMGARRWRLRKA